MGEKKQRIKAFGNKAAPIAEYVKLYQYALKTLYKTLPESVKDSSKSRLATIGRSEIWPCHDGAVVLIRQDRKGDIAVSVKDPLDKKVDDFIKLGPACAYYDKDGKKAPIQALFSVKDATKTILHFADNKIETEGKVFRPNFDRGIIIGWEAELTNPDAQALDDFRSAFLTKNIGGKEALDQTIQEEQRVTKTKAEGLIEQFTELLNTAEKEEEIQVFLKEHPELIYPDFIECFPKFKLGKNFVTDFVYLVQGIEGPEYIFVEIEKQSKRIFTLSGQFTAEFTQAKDQILNWDTWITHNQADISQKLPNIFKPKFHLIMGRSAELTSANMEKIRTEFSATNRMFSTYDEIVARFEQIVERLVN